MLLPCPKCDAVVSTLEANCPKCGAASPAGAQLRSSSAAEAIPTLIARLTTSLRCVGRLQSRWWQHSRRVAVAAGAVTCVIAAVGFATCGTPPCAELRQHLSSTEGGVSAALMNLAPRTDKECKGWLQGDVHLRNACQRVANQQISGGSWALSDEAAFSGVLSANPRANEEPCVSYLERVRPQVLAAVAGERKARSEEARRREEARAADAVGGPTAHRAWAEEERRKAAARAQEAEQRETPEYCWEQGMGSLKRRYWIGAKMWFERLLKKYPKSSMAPQARARLAESEAAEAEEAKERRKTAARAAAETRRHDVAAAKRQVDEKIAELRKEGCEAHEDVVGVPKLARGMARLGQQLDSRSWMIYRLGMQRRAAAAKALRKLGASFNAKRDCPKEDE